MQYTLSDICFSTFVFIYVFACKRSPSVPFAASMVPDSDKLQIYTFVIIMYI